MSIIYLIGARGSGKTTVGRLTAELLQSRFIDLDDYLCEKENCAIAEIVKNYGWQKFRELESKYLREASAGFEHIVISTGGGVILDNENRNFMRKKGFVIWLNARPEILAERLLKNPEAEKRPALTNLDFVEEIKQVLLERKPLYEACAHHVINAEKPENIVAADICRIQKGRLSKR